MNKPFYIFTGPEWVLQKERIDQIAEESNLSVVRMDSFADAYAQIKTPNLLSGPHLYVIRDDEDIIKNEVAQNKLTSESLKGNTVVLLYNSVDKRTKFYKAYKDAIVDFQPLKPEILKKYMQKEIKLSDRNCEKLMEACEYDYGRCLLEIDKVVHWADGYAKDKQMRMPDEEALLRLLNDGTIYTPPYDAIFDFVDAVLDHNINLSYELYRQCREIGEATLVMITVLYDNAKAVLQVQSCESKDIAKTTGLLDWQIRNAQKHIGIHKNSELLQLMETLHRCEMGIKKGTVDEKIAVDYILATFL